jgi:hypothetical protein
MKSKPAWRKSIRNVTIHPVEEVTGYRVECDYLPSNKFPWGSLDKLVAKLARSCKGRFSGAGTDLSTGRRDLGFIFKDEKEAARFLRKLK